MKLQTLTALSGMLVLLAGCSNDGSKNMADAAAIPGSIEDFNRNVNNKAHFAFDQARLEAEGQANMSSVAEWTRKYPQPSLTVEGHCDSRGTREYNLALGEKRAQSAARELRNRQAGAQNINTVSYGKDRLPFGQDNSEATHAQNRVAIANIQ